MFSLIYNDDDEFFGGQILPQFFISFLKSDIEQMPNYCPTSYNRLSDINGYHSNTTASWKHPYEHVTVTLKRFW